MDKNILIALLNCSGQWTLISMFIWFVSTRKQKSNIMLYALWFVALISLPILFGLNNVVPSVSIMDSRITKFSKNLETRQQSDVKQREYRHCSKFK